MSCNILQLQMCECVLCALHQLCKRIKDTQVETDTGCVFVCVSERKRGEWRSGGVG